MFQFIKAHVYLLVFTLIILFALSIRLYHLSSVPPGLHVDEISFGYNAYSLLHTGKDEFGISFPIILRALDDYRPALLSYVMIPFIKLFGLSVWSIRLPSVLLSLITLIALYKITIILLHISQKKTTKQNRKLFPLVGLCVVFLYAISPWSIFLSRLTIDTSAGLALFMLGLWILLQYLVKKRLWVIVLGLFCFALSFYAYNGIKFFLPFFLLCFFLLFFKHFFMKKIQVLIGISLFLIILIPLFAQYKNSANFSRLSYLNFFTQNNAAVLTKSSQRLLYDNTNVLGKVFDNRRILILPLFVSNYLSNLNPMWLYADDYTNYKYKIPDFGLFYLFELPLLFLGIYFVSSKNLFSKRILLLLAFWVFTAIIPAAITIDTPSAVRIYPMLPVFLIFEGCGLFCLLQNIHLQKKILYKLLFFAPLLSTLIISFLWFIHAYFQVFPYEYSQYYGYGVEEAIKYAKLQEKNYQHILISNSGDLTFSYLYFLFYTKYNPQKYLQSGGTKSGDFAANHIIDKYAFISPRIIDDNKGVTEFHEEFFDKNTLYIIDSTDFPKDETIQQKVLKKLKIVKTINYLNGTPAILILSPI